MYTTFIFSFTELDHRHSARGRPVRLHAAAPSARTGGFVRGLRHADRVRVRAAGHRAGHRRLPQRAVPGHRPEVVRAVGAYRGLHRRSTSVGVRHRRDLRAVRHACWRSSSCWCSWAWSRRAAPWPTSWPRAAGRAATRARRRGHPGIFAAIPFAIWFFLAIEGAAMAAEEARDPHRTIPDRLHHRHPHAGGAGLGRDDLRGRRGRLAQARQHQRPAAPGHEGGGGRQQRLAAHAGVDRPVRADRLRSTASSWATRARSSRWRAPATCRATSRGLQPRFDTPHRAHAGRRRDRRRGDLQRRAACSSAARR